MEQTRKEQLSIYYYIKDLFPAFVNVKDEYPQDELVLPTIAIISDPTRNRPFELGGRDLPMRRWAIYVFAQNSGQRDDYLEKIRYEIECNLLVYDYDEGFPPTVSPSQIGSLQSDDIQSSPIRVYQELVKKKYWSGSVTFVTYFNPI